MQATRNFAFLALVSFLFTLHARGQQSNPTPDSCVTLAKLKLADARILHADHIAAGAFPTLPGLQPAEAQPLKRLPALCRVVAQLTPSSDSDIKMELWMPATGWNGRFRGQGNGAFAGVIDIPEIAVAVSQGYASAGTDTGHAGPGRDSSWALGHPQKVIDFGYRAIHEMTRQSRAIIQAYYGSAPKHSYFASCSDGGREALMEAQRFPEDYDGIIAGAPAYDWTALLTNFVFNSQALTLQPDSYIPPAKIPAISSAVLAACDAQDGVTDGILNDPRACHFKPSTLRCNGAETDKCLNPNQVKALEALYSGAHTADGKQLFPGYLPGAEEGSGGWKPWITGPAPNKSAMFAFGHGYFSDFVFEQPEWNYKSASIDDIFKAANAKNSCRPQRHRPEPQAFR
jgi:feruloyl esterase